MLALHVRDYSKLELNCVQLLGSQFMEDANKNIPTTMNYLSI